MTVTQEVSKQVGGFMEVMRSQPLSLALVVMNFLLVAYLFYAGGQQLSQRQYTTDQIIKWQQDTDKLMANCVSKEVTSMMLDNMQRITETQISAAQKDLNRMQAAVDAERELNRRLVEESIKRLQRYQPPPGLPFTPPSRDIGYEQCDPLGPFCGPR